MGRLVKIILQPITFRKMDHVAVLYPENAAVDDIIREMDGAEWSTGYHFWHMPIHRDTIKTITTSLKGIGSIDKSAFKNFKFQESELPKIKKKSIKIQKPSTAQLDRIELFCQSCIQNGYSDGTIKVYRSLLRIFFGFNHSKTDAEISNSDIEHFMNEYIHKNELSTNYKRLMENTLRQYYNFVQND